MSNNPGFKRVFRYGRLMSVVIISVVMLASCGGGGGGGATTPTPTPSGSSNWDEMVWGQDNWG